MGHKLNHRRKKRVERHKKLKRQWSEPVVEGPEIWYYEDGGLLSIDWSKYDQEYWANDWSAAGQNALRWQRFFESLPVPDYYEESRKRRMATMRESESNEGLEERSVICT